MVDRTALAAQPGRAVDLGVALTLWTAVGHAVTAAAPTVRLLCQRKGLRLSLLRVGIPFVTELALVVYIGVRFLRIPLPPPRLRHLPWLQAIEAFQ
jgi:hypothetical protein